MGEVASQVLERMVLGVLWSGVGGVVAQQVQGDRQQLLHHAVVRYERAQARVLLQEPLHNWEQSGFKPVLVIRLNFSFRLAHRLNMEVDLQSLFGLHVHSCTHWLRPRNSTHPPALELVYEGAIGQPR